MFNFQLININASLSYLAKSSTICSCFKALNISLKKQIGREWMTVDSICNSTVTRVNKWLLCAASLVRMKLRVDERWLRVMELNSPQVICGVEVTALDANQ